MSLCLSVRRWIYCAPNPTFPKRLLRRRSCAEDIPQSNSRLKGRSGRYILFLSQFIIQNHRSPIDTIAASPHRNFTQRAFVVWHLHLTVIRYLLRPPKSIDGIGVHLKIGMVRISDPYIEK